MTELGVRIEFNSVPVSYETDAETGEVTAYNDDLRVMAIGADEQTARERFFAALRLQVRRDLIGGRPLHPRLRENVATREPV
jgi:hypothetical protein